ncbi:hypothetical protein QZH41_012603 [Actinostola sp. cb2023]|nr:hypothetical protein QZH41_012603 [Actinostola sp. cb2023]
MEGVHEKSFIVFMASGMFHMFITCLLFYWTCTSPATYQETISLRRKVTLMLVNYVSFGIAVYMFFRHNTHCETGGILYIMQLSLLGQYQL